MMSDSETSLPFSQRTGLQPVPPQLQLGEVSGDFRRLIYYYFELEVGRVECHGYEGSYFEGKWKRFATDFYVLILGWDPDGVKSSPYDLRRYVKALIIGSELGPLFDFIEFLVRHPACSGQLKQDVSNVFVSTRSAYRIVAGQYIIAVGTNEQATALLTAIDKAGTGNVTGTRKHLISAGEMLRNGDWAGSVRESIHAVESMAVRLSPGTSTLGAALKEIEKKGHLHGSLKSAFDKLYGYASDEDGVRHALVFADEAQVDEADALFMLGACASFVSYLLTRSS